MVDLLPPPCDTERTEPEALFPEAKQRARHRHLLIGGGAVLLSAALAIGILLGTSSNGGSNTPPPPPPGFASRHLHDEVLAK